MHSFKSWTESETNILIQSKLDFIPNSDIALILNRSISSIKNKVLEIKKHTEIVSLRNNWSDSEINQLITLRKSKYKLREISAILNRTEYSCREKLRNL